MEVTTPAPERVAAARAAAKLTMTEAAAVVWRPRYQRWSEWENGRKVMPQAEWELFVMKVFPRAQWRAWLE